MFCKKVIILICMCSFFLLPACKERLTMQQAEQVLTNVQLDRYIGAAVIQTLIIDKVERRERVISPTSGIGLMHYKCDASDDEIDLEDGSGEKKEIHLNHISRQLKDIKKLNKYGYISYSTETLYEMGSLSELENKILKDLKGYSPKLTKQEVGCSFDIKVNTKLSPYILSRDDKSIIIKLGEVVLDKINQITANKKDSYSYDVIFSTKIKYNEIGKVINGALSGSNSGIYTATIVFSEGRWVVNKIS